MRRAAAAVAVLLAALALYACDNLYKQRADKTWRPAKEPLDQAIWPLSPPAHTVARAAEPTAPPPLTLALIERGRQRFDIYCAPCHSRLGDGHGMVVDRGFPAPPSYHTERLRKAPFQHFYDVITHGYGIMYSYADRVAPQDRWAIAAYIRTLQHSQDTPLASLSAAQKAELPQ